ncbi:MAG: ribosomal protein L7/L12 [Planctomycetota bacterium]
MGEPLTPEQIQQINEALFAGRRIEAIKLYRDFTGQGLKEAHDFIEVVHKELCEKCPEKFAPGADKAKGCLGVLACLLLPAGAVLFVTCCL